jgi:hypothetical protein
MHVNHLGLIQDSTGILKSEVHAVVRFATLKAAKK